MERRDWSIEALEELYYLNSLDDKQRAEKLVKWHKKYLTNKSVEDFDLEKKDLKKLAEEIYKNMEFLKKHKDATKEALLNRDKIRSYVSNS